MPRAGEEGSEVAGDLAPSGAGEGVGWRDAGRICLVLVEGFMVECNLVVIPNLL